MHSIRAMACAALVASACGGASRAESVTDSPESSRVPVGSSDTAGDEPARVPPGAGLATGARQVTWTHRGYADEPENPNAIVLRFTEVDGTHPEALAMARGIHAELPAVFVCMRAANAVQTIDANLHAQLSVRDAALAVHSSPASQGLEACLRDATRSVSFAGPDRAIASIALMRPQFTQVLPLAPDAPNLIREFGGCHWFETPLCGPADDCQNAGYRPGLCAAAAPASLRFQLRASGARHTLTRFERVGADGVVTFVGPLPFALVAETSDTSEATITIADGELNPAFSGVTAAGNATSLVLVSDTGTVAIRRLDGRVGFAEPVSDDERYGWDDAEGSVTVGAVRCPITDAHRSRLAIACGSRIVVVRAGATVYVLDEQGTLLEKKTMTPSYPGRLRLTPRLEGEVGGVTIRLDGRIYVR